MNDLSKTAGCLFTLLLLFSTTALAQDQSELVRHTIDRFFDGMKTGDSSLVRSTLTTTATLSSVVRNSKDSVYVERGSVSGFLKAIGTPHQEVWDERIYAVKISVDEPMAMVWAPYKFYLGTAFSHCGVNVFMLTNTKTGWKISGITDTRRKTNCPGD
jgi:hypothetical protein